MLKYLLPYEFCLLCTRITDCACSGHAVRCQAHGCAKLLARCRPFRALPLVSDQELTFSPNISFRGPRAPRVPWQLSWR
jgi:hypothetical protein